MSPQNKNSNPISTPTSTSTLLLGGALGGCLIVALVAGLALAATTLGAARGCAGALEETERGILATPQAFLDALRQDDHARAYALLSADFQDAHTLAAFEASTQAQRALLDAGSLEIKSVRARGRLAALTVDLHTQPAPTRATFLLTAPQPGAQARAIEAFSLDPKHTRAAIALLAQAHLEHLNAGDADRARALMTPALGGSGAGRGAIEALTGPAGAWLRGTRPSIDALEVDPHNSELVRARATAETPDGAPRGELTYVFRRSAHGVWLIDALGTSSRETPLMGDAD